MNVRSGALVLPRSLSLFVYFLLQKGIMGANFGLLRVVRREDLMTIAEIRIVVVGRLRLVCILLAKLGDHQFGRRSIHFG